MQDPTSLTAHRLEFRIPRELNDFYALEENSDVINKDLIKLLNKYILLVINVLGNIQYMLSDEFKDHTLNKQQINRIKTDLKITPSDLLNSERQIINDELYREFATIVITVGTSLFIALIEQLDTKYQLEIKPTFILKPK